MSEHEKAWRLQPTREVEPHDSTLAAVEAADDRVVLRLAPAYVITSGDEPARNGGAGWAVDVDIVLEGAELRSAPATLPAWISDGFVGLAGAARMYLLTLPSTHDGDLTVYFLTENAEELLVKARRMEVIQRGEPAYVERIDPEFWR